MTVIALEPERARGGRFYVWLAGAMVAIAFLGFAPTYWLQLPTGSFVGGPLLHVHALLFSAWPLLFLAQTMLAANGRLRNHRALGVAGVSLASLMVAVGLATALQRLNAGLAAGYGDGARGFLIVQVGGLVTFAGFFAAAVALATRPDWHKRLMVAATASLLQAPLARIPFLIVAGAAPGLRPGVLAPPPVAITIAPSMAANRLLVAGLIYDIRTRGRPHPAYPIGLVVLAATTLLRVPISHAPACRRSSSRRISPGRRRSSARRARG